MSERRRLAARAAPLFLGAAAAAVIWGIEGTRGAESAGSEAEGADGIALSTAYPSPAALSRVAAARVQELPEGVTPGMVEQGRALFTGRGLCYTCHGRDGSGRPELGSDLTDDRWAHGDGSYGYLVRRIKEGVSAQASSTGVPMPPRAGTDLTDAEVEAVAAYVWTLSRVGGSGAVGGP